MNQETLQKIVNRFGKQTQINKIQEECLELALVLNQMNCPTKDSYEMEEKLYSELADVHIMVAQFPFLFDQERIDSIVRQKLIRVNKYFFKEGEVVGYENEFYIIQQISGKDVLLHDSKLPPLETINDFWVDMNELEKI